MSTPPNSPTPIVPIIDFSPFLDSSSGDASAKARVARELDDAFRNVGFVYLRNHGVDLEEVGRAFEWSKKFFDLPVEVKGLAPHPPGGSHHRGYSGIGVEKVIQSGLDVVGERDREAWRAVPDYKESFEIGNTDDALQPNIWLPEHEIPGFKEFMTSFFTTCSTLIHQILKALATSLSLPSEDTLSKTHSKSLFQTRLLHYPSLPAAALRKGEKSRISAHSDFGTLTLLFQDSTGGLEIEDPLAPGTFRAARPVEGTVVVNVGDLMERWSNGRWRSGVHRVVAPPVGQGKVGGEAGEEMVQARYSIPFFATADPETVVEALEGCWDGVANPKRFGRTTAWEYVQMRMAASY